MSKKLSIIFASLCFAGFCLSVIASFTVESQAVTPEEGIVRFLRDGFDFDISVWWFFAFGFLLCTAFWIWRLLRLRHESYA
jgi:hypothetical protein